MQEKIEKARLEAAKEEGKAAAANAKVRLEEVRDASTAAETKKIQARNEKRELAMHVGAVLCGNCSAYVVSTGSSLDG